MKVERVTSVIGVPDVEWQLGDVIEDADGDFYMVIEISRPSEFRFGLLFLNHNIVGVDTYPSIENLQRDWKDCTLVQEDLVIKPVIRK